MAPRRRNMYFLKRSSIVGGVTAISNTIGEVTSNTNRLLKHANDSTLFKSDKNCKFEVCEPCALEIQTQVKFGIVVHHTMGMLDYIKRDV